MELRVLPNALRNQKSSILFPNFLSFFKMKKADVWISAVLYMALGIILLTLILAAGLPVITKIKDKNTALQTKEVMFELDKSIRAVYTQGPGSQRPLTLEMHRGQLLIDDLHDQITWRFDTSVLLSEPDALIREGNFIIQTQLTPVNNRYTTLFILNYTDLLNITSPLEELSGKNQVMIANVGSSTIPVISITAL